VLGGADDHFLIAMPITFFNMLGRATARSNRAVEQVQILSSGMSQERSLEEAVSPPQALQEHRAEWHVSSCYGPRGFGGATEDANSVAETCSTRADSRTSRMAPSRVTQQFACRKQPRQARRACAPQDPGNRNRTAENLLPAIAQKVEAAIGPRRQGRREW
jgi:hypothetical protein